MYHKGWVKAKVYGGFYFVITVFQSSAFACILYIVSQTFDQEGLTIGTCMAYLLYMRKIVDNFGEMSNAIQQIAKVSGASYKVAEMIVTAPQVVIAKNGKRDETPCGTMDLQNVKFYYPTKKDVPVLHNVTIDVPSNNVVALVGASGCGKSSVMKLLERFYDPEEGRLLFNGIDLKEVDNTWFHQSQLAIVQQEPALFSGSIRDNIFYGTDYLGLSETEKQERFDLACNQANVYTFLNDKALFPEGD